MLDDLRTCRRCGEPLTRNQKAFCSSRCAIVWRNQNTMTSEKRARISASLSGRPNAYKGRHYSEQARRNMSVAHIGNTPPNKGIKTGKPAWNRGVPHREETKQKISKVQIQRGNFSARDCGNGRPLPRPHQLLYDALVPIGWVYEYPISLGKRQPGWPTHYKADLAFVESKLVIEVDGASHRMIIARKRDAKKDGKLTDLGWTVVRVPNERAIILSTLSAADIVAELFGIVP